MVGMLFVTSSTLVLGSRRLALVQASVQKESRLILHKYTYNADKQCVAQLYIDLINTVYSAS